MSQGKASIDDIQEGDKVQYFTIPGSGTHSTGVVEAILTEPQPAGSTGVTVKASEDEPRIVIKNDHTGKATAYKLDHIEKVLEGGGKE